MKTAIVARETPGASAARTQCGVARRRPPDAICRVSPHWKAQQSGGIAARTSAPERLRMKSPARGSGHAISFPLASK